MEKKLKMQDVPTEIAKMDMDEVEAEVPEMKLRRLIKELQRRLDDLHAQDIEDLDLQDTINMMKDQLGMLDVQKKQALKETMMGGMGRGQTTERRGVGP